MLVICNGMPRSASTWAFNVAVELQNGGVAYDQETLLHPAHIRDGGSGYGSEALTADQLRQCEELIRRYLQHPRREYLLQRLALTNVSRALSARTSTMQSQRRR